MRPPEVEPSRQPHRVVHEQLEERGPALGDGVVAEATGLERQLGRGVRVVLGVPGLVEERVPVVRPAHRLDHEDDAAGDSIGAQKARGDLLGRVLDVELDVLLRARSIPSSPRVPVSAGSIASAGKPASQSVARRRRRMSGRVASSRPDPAVRRSLVGGGDVEILGVGQQAARGTAPSPSQVEAEALVELEVRCRRRAPASLAGPLERGA